MRRMKSTIYLLSCLVLFSLFTAFTQAFAQFAPTTSDQLLNAQITASAQVGSNDLQASVIIVAGESVFIDAGKVAGVEKSNYRGGQIMRRTSSGQEFIGNFEIIEIGGEVSQIAVTTVFAKEVQMSDRAIFGAFSAEAGIPGENSMQASQIGQANGQNVFTNTFGNNPAGRSIGLAANSMATNSMAANGMATNTNSGFGNTTDIQVTKSTVVPTGTAAALAAPVTVTTTTTVTANTPASTPAYCSSQVYQSRPECGMVANSSQSPLVGQRGYQPNQAAQQSYQQVSQTTTSTSLPGYCIDARFSSRPECRASGGTTTTSATTSSTTSAFTTSPNYTNTMTVSSNALPAYCSTPRNQSRSECSGASSVTQQHTYQANQVSSALPAYCSTPRNQSRPECSGASSVVQNRAYQTGNSHISTATAANPNATAAGTAQAIDPYTGQPYTTSYQGYSGDNAATPLVHSAAQSQSTQSQTQVATPTYSAATTTATMNAPNYGTVGLAPANASPNSVINIPAHVGPATVANQTLSTPANSSYRTAQTYYDTNWGDNWDPTFVNTTPTASGIIPADSPAPYYLRIARVKNNLGFPNEAIGIINMGLVNHPNDNALQSELTMIYAMLNGGLNDGDTPDDWCAPQEIGLAPEPTSTADDCPEEEEVALDHSHIEGADDYTDDHHHDDEEVEVGHDDDSNNQYANDHNENIQVSTRYNAPVNNRAHVETDYNDHHEEENDHHEEDGYTTNKPAFTSPVGMANSYYSDEKGGIVRPLWNTEK